MDLFDFDGAIERIGDFAAGEAIDLLQLDLVARSDGFETFVFTGDGDLSGASGLLAQAFDLGAEGLDWMGGFAGSPNITADGFGGSADMIVLGPQAGAFDASDIGGGDIPPLAANRNGNLDPIEGAAAGGSSGVSSIVWADQYHTVAMHDLHIAYAPADFAI